MHLAIHALARVTVAAAAFFAAAALPACRSAPDAPAGERSITSLTGEWTLEQLRGVDLSGLLPPDARRPSLSFDPDGKVTGFAGVNRLSSSLDLSALATGDFVLSPAITTKMAGPPASNRVETDFLSALGEATRFRTAGDTLTLGNDTETLLTFVRGQGPSGGR